MPLDNRRPCLCYICSSLPWAMTWLYGWSLLFYISLPMSLFLSVFLHSADCVPCLNLTLIWRLGESFTSQPVWHLCCFHVFPDNWRCSRGKNAYWCLTLRFALCRSVFHTISQGTLDSKSLNREDSEKQENKLLIICETKSESFRTTKCSSKNQNLCCISPAKPDFCLCTQITPFQPNMGH